MNILYELPALKVPYQKVKYYWATSHYDLDWQGYVRYNGFMWKAKTVDETDYDKMTETCPYCRVDGLDINIKECHCENYTNVYVYLTPMSFGDKIRMYYDKFKWEHIERPYLFWKNRKRLK